MWTEKIMDRELATAISDVLIELASEIVQASARFLHEAAHRPRKPLRKNTIYSYKVSIRNLHDVLEDLPMRGLKIHHIRHYVNERKKRDRTLGYYQGFACPLNDHVIHGEYRRRLETHTEQAAASWQVFPPGSEQLSTISKIPISR